MKTFFLLSIIFLLGISLVGINDAFAENPKEPTVQVFVDTNKDYNFIFQLYTGLTDEKLLRVNTSISNSSSIIPITENELYNLKLLPKAHENYKIKSVECNNVGKTFFRADHETLILQLQNNDNLVCTFDIDYTKPLTVNPVTPIINSTTVTPILPIINPVLELTATILDDETVRFDWDKPTYPFELYSFKICDNRPPVLSYVPCFNYSLSNTNTSVTITHMSIGIEYLITLRSVTSETTFIWTFRVNEDPTFSVTIPINYNDIVTAAEPQQKKSSTVGGGCNDCTAPTLGKDKEGVLRVENGITINDISKDGGYYYTEYPMIYTNIGDENNVTLKFWENQGPTNIEMFQLASVKEKGTSFGESQWMIEVWLNDFRNDIDNPTIKEIKVFDKDNLLSNVNATVYLSQCLSTSNVVNDCLSVQFEFTNEQVPNSPVLVAEAMDYKRNVFQNFFNDGLQVIDPNYVEPTIQEPYKYKCNDKPLDEIMNGGDRKNCNWRAEKMSWLWDN